MENKHFLAQLGLFETAGAADVMANVESAKQRLEQAVNRLETAVGSLSGGDSGKVAALEKDRARLQAELAALQTKHDALTSRFTESQDAQAALEKVIDKVSERLDTTIGRLKAVLDS